MKYSVLNDKVRSSGTVYVDVVFQNVIIPRSFQLETVISSVQKGETGGDSVWQRLEELQKRLGEEKEASKKKWSLYLQNQEKQAGLVSRLQNRVS